MSDVRCMAGKAVSKCQAHKSQRASRADAQQTHYTPVLIAVQTEEATDRLSFESFSGYGLNLIGSQLRIAPDGTLQHGPQNLVPLYHLELPAGLTVIPVYSPSDLHHALALLANPDFQQRMQDEFEAHAEVILESYSRPIHCAVVQLMVDVSLSALDWPAAGMAVTCPLLLQGVPHSSYETGLSIDLGLTNDTFLRVEGSGAVTFR